MAKKSSGKGNDPSKLKDNAKEFANGLHDGLSTGADTGVKAGLKGMALWAGAFAGAEIAQHNDAPATAVGLQVLSDSAGFVGLTGMAMAIPIIGAHAVTEAVQLISPAAPVVPRAKAHSVGKAFAALSAVAAAGTALSYTVPRAGFTTETPTTRVSPLSHNALERINLSSLQQEKITAEPARADTKVDVVRALKAASANKPD